MENLPKTWTESSFPSQSEDESNPRDAGKGWIGFDLDGTLAQYDGVHRGENYIGAPIEPMVRLVRKYLAQGRDVRIFTARRPHPAIRRFCYENFGKILPITNVKDHEMQALFDDRAVGVKRNEGKPFAEANITQMFVEEEE